MAFDFCPWWEPEPLVWVPDEWSKILVGNRLNSASTKVLSIFVGWSRLLFPLHATTDTTVLSLGVFFFAVAQTHTHTSALIAPPACASQVQRSQRRSTVHTVHRAFRSSQPTPTPIAVPPEILSACFLLFPLESFFLFSLFVFLPLHPRPITFFPFPHLLSFSFIHIDLFEFFQSRALHFAQNNEQSTLLHSLAKFVCFPLRKVTTAPPLPLPPKQAQPLYLFVNRTNCNNRLGQLSLVASINHSQ